MKWVILFSISALIVYESTASDNSDSSVKEKCSLTYNSVPYYKPYRQGPCPVQHYLVFDPDYHQTSSDAMDQGMCTKNPCLEDGLVPFQGGCHRLYHLGPPVCKEVFSYLDASPDNFELKCIPMKLGPDDNRQPGIINPPPKECPNGQKLNPMGECKKVFS